MYVVARLIEMKLSEKEKEIIINALKMYLNGKKITMKEENRYKYIAYSYFNDVENLIERFQRL